MGFRKKISPGVISAVCVFAFVACGDSKGTPKCDDKEVQKRTWHEVCKNIRYGIRYVQRYRQKGCRKVCKKYRVSKYYYRKI